MSLSWNWFVHKVLARPYRLNVAFDRGSGPAVVVLHGIGSSGRTWQRLADELADTPVRVVALDLLGHGASPKPTDDWAHYSARDQARSVLATLRAQRVRGPYVVVGHSMGCFVAVEVATLQPRRVKRLILYEPPFYAGLPARNLYRLRLRAYFALFNAVLKTKPDSAGFRRIQKLIARQHDFELTPDNWVPFERSLRNAIMQQTALEGVKKLTTPTQIIYGTRDNLVINDKKKLFFGETAAHVSSGQIREQHTISARAVRALAALIREDR